jgi:uncharacterized protein YwqG
MGVFSRLFGPKEPPRPPRDVAALAAHLARPALRLLPGLPVRDAPSAHSWFLGEPDLPAGTAWPEWKGRKLGHLASIDLEQLQTALAMDWLPRQGSLAFFYDLEERPWGEPKHRGGWSVIHRPDRATSRSPESRPISFQTVLTYPPSDRPEAEAFDFNDAEWDLYCDLEHARTGVEYVHKLGGFQSVIQSDSLEEESQEGIEGRNDWRLLLQIASDQSLDFSWGDGGNLYFMIRESDARAGRFEDVWLISQCF